MDYREMIKAEFLKRRQDDPFYSLRSFAKDLEILPSHLSYIMRGQRGLSKENAQRVALRMGLTSVAVQHFRFLVSAQSGRSKTERGFARQGLQRKYLKK